MARARAPRPWPKACVYAWKWAEHPAIKIGRTSNTEGRLRGRPTDCPPLGERFIVGFIPFGEDVTREQMAAVEAAVHRHPDLAPRRSDGEWFLVEPDVVQRVFAEFIERLGSPRPRGARRRGWLRRR